MYFLCFTLKILLKGSNGDELKKVKHVVQYGVFAAYHLALETSFLADEGASPLEFPLKSPITVALPDKPSSIVKSISTIPGFSFVTGRGHQGAETNKEVPKCNDGYKTRRTSSSCSGSVERSLAGESIHMHEISGDVSQLAQDMSSSHCNSFPTNTAFEKDDKERPKESLHCRQDEGTKTMIHADIISDFFGTLEPSGRDGNNHIKAVALASDQGPDPESPIVKHDDNNNNFDNDMIHSKEDFPPSTSDHQSILVFLSTRCVWKGTVCERSHLVRIKYYGSSDKPLGRFLKDQLFDEVFVFPNHLFFK